MNATTLPGGTWTLGDQPISRFGYGAMQLTGPGVMGPPADPEAAAAVLREVVALGITHIDTSDAYGPHVTNALIREALAPYPPSLRIVTKVGAVRDAGGGWPTARRPAELREQVIANLTSLGVESLDVVNLRLGDARGTVEEPLGEALDALMSLRDEGLIRHIGLSNVTPGQVAQALDRAPIVCVQNLYNVAYRGDDGLIDQLAERGVAYVPYFPLGGFSPLQSDSLTRVATRRQASVRAVALSWLLQRSPNLLLIPGTSSVAHLRDNLAGAAIALTEEDLADLDRIGVQDGRP